MNGDTHENVLHLQYRDKASVYNCYMAFCKDGGLFIPSAPPHVMHLGTQLFLLVELPESRDIHTVSGRVAWINFGKRQGVGLRLNADEWGKGLRTSIENLLAGNLKSGNPTLTM